MKKLPAIRSYTCCSYWPFLLLHNPRQYRRQKGFRLELYGLLKKVEAGEVTDITIVGYEAVALKKDSTIKKEAFPKKYDYYVYLPSYYQVDIDLKAALGVQDLADAGVSITYQKIQDNSIWLDVVLPYLVPILLMGALWYMMYRQTQGGGKGLNYGKSRAKMTMGENVKTTFADVAARTRKRRNWKKSSNF